MDNFPYADIVILALIAGFILLRLRSILGQRSDDDQPQFFKRDVADQNIEDDSVVKISSKAAKAKPVDPVDSYLNTLDNPAIAATLADIKKIDTSFSATGFLQGAKMAYEMVFDAFAKGDKKTLEMLLDKPIYDTFVLEIDRRAQDSTKTEITLVSIAPKHIVQAALMGTKARLTVQFESEQVIVVKDASGAIVEGNVSQSSLMDDEWIFERDVSSKNPNWKIIET